MQNERDDFERLGPAAERDAARDAGGRATRRAENLADDEFELRPRGVGAIVDLGLELVRSRFAVAVGLAICLWLPIQLLNLLVAPDPEKLVMADASDVMYVFLASSTSNLATGLMNLLTSALTARLLFDAFQGQRTSAFGALRATVGRLPGLVVIGIVSALILMAGFCVFFFGVFGAMWMVTPMAYVYVIERRSLGATIQRGFQLSYERLFSWPSFYSFWRWAGVTLVATMLSAPFSGLASVAVTHDVRSWVLNHVSVARGSYDLVAVLVGALFLGIGTTIQSGVLTAYYVDCRVRRDGLDLERWQQRLSGSSAGGIGAVVP